MDRMQELLKHVTRGQRGIEIGPYHNPIAPRRLAYQTIILDVFDTEELRRRAKVDPNIPSDTLPHIEDVDLQGSAGQIAELVKQQYGDERFDYVLSSHNLEHMPDPIRFFQGCEQVLKPGGVVTMAIPDRRYCFDFFRPITTTAEWLEAYHERRTKPTPTQVFQQGSLHSLLGGQIAWSQEATSLPTPGETLERSFSDWQTQTQGDAPYHDAHCWTFTPASLELILTDLRHLGLLKLDLLEFQGPSGCEFYVHLRNPSGERHHDRKHFYSHRAGILQRVAAESGWAPQGHASIVWSRCKRRALTMLQRLPGPARRFLRAGYKLAQNARGS